MDEAFSEAVQVITRAILNRGEMSIQEDWKREDFSSWKLGR